MKYTILTLLALGLLAANANADTWYAQTNGPYDNASEWNSDPSGSGTSPAALPIAGDTDTWVMDINGRSYWNVTDIVWYGGTTIVTGNDEIYHAFGSMTLQDVELQGGDNPRNSNVSPRNAAVLNLDKATKYIGDTLTIATGYTGTLGMERSSGSIAFSTYTGDGDLLVSGWDNAHHDFGAGAKGPYRFVDGGDFSTFTGSITLEYVNAGFDYDITSETFDLIVQNEAIYNLANSVKVTSLTVDGESFDSGTYEYADFTSAGKDSFFADAGGTITVVGTNVVLGDANGDGVVNAADYIALKTHMGQATGAELADGDFDEDDDVDFDDLQILIGDYGSGSAAPGAMIPEPASVMLLMFGAAALVRRRRR